MVAQNDQHHGADMDEDISRVGLQAALQSLEVRAHANLNYHKKQREWNRKSRNGESLIEENYPGNFYDSAITNKEIDVFSHSVEEFATKITGQKPSTAMWVTFCDYSKKRLQGFSVDQWNTDEYRIAETESLIEWLKNTRIYLHFLYAMRPKESLLN